MRQRSNIDKDDFFSDYMTHEPRCENTLRVNIIISSRACPFERKTDP